MSRKRDHNQGSGAGIAIIAGLIGAGIGALGAFIFSKFSEDQKKQPTPVTQSRQHNYVPRNIQRATTSSSHVNNEKLEETLLCPISQQLMEDPMTIPECGHTFDKKSIVPILNKYHMCPLCRKPTSADRLVPNYQLKHVIDHYNETRK